MSDAARLEAEMELAGVRYACWVTSSRPDGGDADDEMVLEVRSSDLKPLLFVSYFSGSDRLCLTGQAAD